MKKDYEFIVIGCGGIGSAALYWLARHAGREVLGLERFHLGHDYGGSQDHSRIIRLSYHDPAYTALTPHTYTAWRVVEAESGVQLVFKTGGLQLGPGDESGQVVEAYAAAMRATGIPFEQLTPAEAMARFPQWRLHETDRVLYQPDDGLVDPRKANAVHTTLARARGATILEQTPIQRLRLLADGVEVETPAGRFMGRRVVVAAGAWTNQVLQSLGVRLPLTVTEEQVTYFATPHLRDFAPDRFPIWIWHGRENFYGFPVYGEVATKAGQDLGGDVVTVDTRTLKPNPRPLEKLQAFLAERVPGFLGPVLYTKPCLYTMPPDRNFVVDTLPEHPQIAVVIGAGHAFKFAALLGRILCDLAVEGKTVYPIAAFSLRRPAITDPDFPLALDI